MNRKELEQCLQENYKKIYFLALKMLRNREDAEDATQEVMFQAYRKIEQFRAEAKFSTWLFRIALNHIYSVVKKKKKMKNFTSRDLKTEINQNPETVLLENELFEKLDEIIAELPLQQKEVFLLRYYDKLKFKKIAQISEKKLGTVKSNYFFAMEKIKKV